MFVKQCFCCRHLDVLPTSGKGQKTCKLSKRTRKEGELTQCTPLCCFSTFQWRLFGTAGERFNYLRIPLSSLIIIFPLNHSCLHPKPSSIFFSLPLSERTDQKKCERKAGLTLRVLTYQISPGAEYVCCTCLRRRAVGPLTSMKGLDFVWS